MCSTSPPTSKRTFKACPISVGFGASQEAQNVGSVSRAWAIPAFISASAARTPTIGGSSPVRNLAMPSRQSCKTRAFVVYPHAVQCSQLHDRTNPVVRIGRATILDVDQFLAEPHGDGAGSTPADEKIAARGTHLADRRDHG